MNNQEPYVFILTDKEGSGTIKRFTNSCTKVTVPMSQFLQRINLAQDVLEFEEALDYANTAKGKHQRLNLRIFTFEEYKKDTPVTKHFKNIFRRK